MYEKSLFKVQIEGDRISLYCQDDRIIAEGLNEEYRNFAHKRITPEYFERFLECITAEFWVAGVKEGRKSIVDELRKIDEYFRAILGKNE